MPRFVLEIYHFSSVSFAKASENLDLGRTNPVSCHSAGVYTKHFKYSQATVMRTSAENIRLRKPKKKTGKPANDEEPQGLNFLSKKFLLFFFGGGVGK